MSRSSYATFFFVATVAALTAQERKIDVPWMHGPEAASFSYAPRHAWTSAGKLLVEDTSAGLASARVDLIDPVAKTRTRVLDLRRPPREIWKLNPGSVPRLLLPDAYDPTGRWALYSVGGDLYVAALEGEEVRRITETPVPETSARFSPDGAKLAFIRANDLWVHDLVRKREVRLTTDGSATVLNGTLSWVYWEEIFGRRDLGYWWSPDSAAIAYLRTDESAVGEMTYLDHRSIYPTVIRQRYPKVGGVNPAVRVGVVAVPDSETAASTTWIDLGSHDWEYVARITWLDDSARLIVQTLDRGQSALTLSLAKRADGSTKEIFTERDPGWVNIHDDLFVMHGGEQLLWASERDGHYHVYRYSLAGELLGRVSSGEFSLRDPSGVYWTRQAVKAVDEKAGHVYASSLEKSSIESHLYRFALDGSRRERVSVEDGTHKISFRDDAAFYVDEYSRANRPPSLALHDKNGAVVMTIQESRAPALAKMGFVYPEFLTVPADDGFPMPAYVFRPKDFDPAKRYPVVFYGYGGPSAPSVSDRWGSSRLYFNQLLLDRGYIVACFDNRSATARSKTLENTILNQMCGDGELADLVAGVRWFKKKPWVDGDRVGLWGWSGGGSLTLLGMTRSREFKAGIAVAAVTRWQLYDTRWTEAVMKHPRDNARGYRLTDLVDRAKNLHGRLLLVHGTRDDNVHLQNAWAFSDALIDAGKIFEMMIYPMRKHGIADSPARIHLFGTMLDFWERNL